MSDKMPPRTVWTYGFNIPCRRFLITAHVTKDRRLPIVDEFVLRILKLCDRVPVKRLGTFLGFSALETEIAIGDLVSRSLVVVEGDTAYLHPSAHEMFRASEDGLPRMMEVETWVERVWFDLVSRNMMAGDRTRQARNLLDVAPDKVSREMPVSFARRAFEDNFGEYLRRVRRLTNRDGLGLYSISEVVPERFGFMVLRGREDLVFDAEPRLDRHLLDVDVEEVGRLRALSEAMTDSYRRLTDPEPSLTAVREFVKLTGDLSLLDAQIEGERYDLAKWIAPSNSPNDGRQRRIVGASYVSSNWDAFLELVTHVCREQFSKSSPRKVELLWLRPGGTRWGTSPDLAGCVGKLQTSLQHALSHKWSLEDCLIVPQSVRPEVRERFNGVFDRLVPAPAGYLSPALEVILVRGIAAFVSVCVWVSRSVRVFAGLLIGSSDVVARIEEHLRLDLLPKANDQRKS